MEIGSEKGFSNGKPTFDVSLSMTEDQCCSELILFVILDHKT